MGAKGMAERNMYGCLPCPKCASVYRAPYKRHYVEPRDVSIECDCGFTEPGRFSDGGYVVDAIRPATSGGKP